MVTHIVFWKLKDEAEGNDRHTNAQIIIKALSALPDIIPEVLELHAGENTNNGDYHLALVTRFNSFEDLETYNAHPEHQKVLSFIRKVISERSAVDF